MVEAIGKQMEIGETGQGWQEVRGRRAEKRAQGGSTGASPAKPDAQRRTVEASGGGSIAEQQDSSEQGEGAEPGKEDIGVASKVQLQQPRTSKPVGSSAAWRA